jgi:hypothetical protein
MAQVVENWSEVDGRVVAATPAPDRPDFVEVVIDADAVRPVGDWPNLLEDVAGTRIDVLVPRAALDEDLEPGAEIAWQVRRARSGIFAHPDHVGTGGAADDDDERREGTALA